MVLSKRAHGAHTWLVLAGLAVAMPATAVAQKQEAPSWQVFGMGESGSVQTEGNPSYDGRYTFVRIRQRELLEERPMPCYDSDDGPGWRHDYPRAERNFLQILDQVTSLQGRGDSSMVLYADDPLLLRYPVAYIAESGCWKITEKEVQGLRQYLLKGGFLIVDDLTFGGGLSNDLYTLSQQNFEEYIHKVLPESKLITIDEKSPIFHTFFTLDPKVVPADGEGIKFRAIFEDNDPAKRPLVVATYNTSIGHYWRWASQGFYAVDSTNEAYKFGVNYLLYGLTH